MTGAGAASVGRRNSPIPQGFCFCCIPAILPATGRRWPWRKRHWFRCTGAVSLTMWALAFAAIPPMKSGWYPILRRCSTTMPSWLWPTAPLGRLPDGRFTGRWPERPWIICCGSFVLMEAAFIQPRTRTARAGKGLSMSLRRRRLSRFWARRKGLILMNTSILPSKAILRGRVSPI